MLEIRDPMRFATIIPLAFLSCFCRAQDTCDVSLQLTPPTCPGDGDGVITVVEGQPGPYTYTWSHDPLLTGPTATGLDVGPYSVLVEDASGCMAMLDTVMNDPDLPALGQFTTIDISCPGAADGSATFQVEPGPYTWQWVQPATASGTTLTNLGPGELVILVEGGPCPSYINAWLDDPSISIDGPTSYCPSDPPHLSVQAEWGFQPHVYAWSTGDSLAFLDIEPGTSGTVEVTATDTIINCTLTSSVTLTVLPSPTVAFSAPDSVCLRTGNLVFTTASDADSLVWRWGTSGFSNDSITWARFDAPLWQPISLQGFDAFGCGNVPVRDSVFVRPRLPADLTAVQVPCTPLVDLRFNSLSDSCAFFLGDSLILDICSGYVRWDMRRYQVYDLTFYSTQPNRCDDTTAISIDVRTEPTLFLPNAFSPDGDGINDEWPGLVDIPEEEFEVEVFDRWGISHWRTTDTQAKWNGSSLPIGVYLYTMRMRDPCEPTNQVSKRGTVTILR